MCTAPWSLCEFQALVLLCEAPYEQRVLEQCVLALAHEAPLVLVEGAHARSSLHANGASCASVHHSRERRFTCASLPVSPAARFRTGRDPVVGHSWGLGTPSLAKLEQSDLFFLNFDSINLSRFSFLSFFQRN